MQTQTHLEELVLHTRTKRAQMLRGQNGFSLHADHQMLSLMLHHQVLVDLGARVLVVFRPFRCCAGIDDVDALLRGGAGAGS